MSKDRFRRLVVAFVVGVGLNFPVVSSMAQEDEKPKTEHEKRLEELQEQKALADAEKAAAEARSAQIQAEIDAAKAPFGVVEGSDAYKTGVTVGQNSGKFEAFMLATLAMEKGVEELLRSLQSGGINNNASLLLMTGTLEPITQANDYYEMRFGILENAVTAANVQVGDAVSNATLREQEAKKLFNEKTETPEEETTAALTGVELDSSLAVLAGGLDAAAKFASYFKTEYKVASLELDDQTQVLISSVAKAAKDAGYTKIYTDSSLEILPISINIEQLEGQIDGLNKSVVAILAKRPWIQGKIVYFKELKKRKSDQIKEGEYGNYLEQVTAGLSALESAKALADLTETEFNSFIDDLTSSDSEISIEKVSAAKRLKTALTNSGNWNSTYVVHLHIADSGGTTYTKNNLWTGLGSMPFYISGGAVLRMDVIKVSDGRVIASEIIPVYSDFLKVNKVKKLVDQDTGRLLGSWASRRNGSAPERRKGPPGRR